MSLRWQKVMIQGRPSTDDKHRWLMTYKLAEKDMVCHLLSFHCCLNVICTLYSIWWILYLHMTTNSARCTPADGIFCTLYFLVFLKQSQIPANNCLDFICELSLLSHQRSHKSFGWTRSFFYQHQSCHFQIGIFLLFVAQCQKGCNFCTNSCTVSIFKLAFFCIMSIRLPFLHNVNKLPFSNCFFFTFFFCNVNKVPSVGSIGSFICSVGKS